MPSNRLIIDGLWRCLCPSIDSIAVVRAVEMPFVLSSKLPSTHTSQRIALCSRPRSESRRNYGSVPESHDAKNAPGQGKYARDRPPETTVQELLDCTPPYLELKRATIPMIYDALRVLRNQSGSFRKVAAFVLYVVRERGQTPSPFLYETLVHVMMDTRCSATSLAAILDEMKELQINRSAVLCESALAVLAIHPNYVLRNRILKTMKEGWLQPTGQGEQYILLGLLRDGQYEMAFEKLEQMVQKRTGPEPWVYDIFIYAFTRLGFLDEAIKITQSKLQNAELTIAGNLWYYLFDTCSSSFHYEGTKYLWRRTVETYRINPSDGMVLNTLNTAARYHDTSLATKAIELMTERGTKLHAHHFEALIDCYVGREDTANALQALCIMHKAGVHPMARSTRTLYHALVTNPGLLDTTVNALHDLRKQGEVPIAAVDVVIEAMVELGMQEPALNIYSHIGHLCSEAPGLRTIQLLLKNRDSLDTARFLAVEQPALLLKANKLLYESIILDSAESGRVDNAFRLLEAIPTGTDRNDWITARTALAVIRAGVEAGDKRVYGVIDEARRRNMPVGIGLDEIRERLQTGPQSASGVWHEDKAGVSRQSLSG